MPYLHTFYVKLTQSVVSKHSEFDDAIDDWVREFSDSSELREALLDTCDSTETIVKELEFYETEELDDERDEPETPHYIWTSGPISPGNPLYRPQGANT